MRPLLLPLGCAALAFGSAWWWGAHTSPDFPAPSTPPPASPAADNSAALPYGLARETARQSALHRGDLLSIRRQLESGTLDSADAAYLAKKWAQADPAGIWKWWNGPGKDKVSGIDMTGLIFRAWAQKDPPGALTAFRTIRPESRAEPARAMLNLLLEKDATSFQPLLPALDELAKACGGSLSVYPGDTAPKLAALLAKLPPGPGRDQLMGGAAQAWMDNDWQASTNWVASLPEPARSNVARKMALKAFDREYWNFYPDPEKTKAAQAGSLAWAKAWLLTEASPADRRQLGPALVRQWAASDPDGAMAWALQNLQSKSLTEAIGQLIQTQLAKDPTAARSLVEALPPGGMKRAAAFSAVPQPDAASVTWLMQQVGDKDRNPWAQAGANWARRDPAGLKSWLESQPAPSAPPWLIIASVATLTRSDAPGTVEWAMKTQPITTTGMALESWSQTDAPSAATWLKTHADAAWSTTTIDRVTKQYFQHTPTAAVAWATALPAGPTRETALATLQKNLTTTPTLPPETLEALKAALTNP